MPPTDLLLVLIGLGNPGADRAGTRLTASACRTCSAAR